MALGRLLESARKAALKGIDGHLHPQALGEGKMFTKTRPRAVFPPVDSRNSISPVWVAQTVSSALPGRARGHSSAVLQLPLTSSSWHPRVMAKPILTSMQQF